MIRTLPSTGAPLAAGPALERTSEIGASAANEIGTLPKSMAVAGANWIGPLGGSTLGCGAGSGRPAVSSVIPSLYHSPDTPWGYRHGPRPGPPHRPFTGP